MTTLGLTGTRDVDAHGEIVGLALNELNGYDAYVTGGCRGFDNWAGRMLWMRNPHSKHYVIVPANLAQVHEWWEEEGVKNPFDQVLKANPPIIVEMPAGTSYKDRNLEIVKRSNELFYCARYPEVHGSSRRSGSWQTVRLARAAGMDPMGIVLSEFE